MTSTVQELLTPEQAAQRISRAYGFEVKRVWVLRNFPQDLRINFSGATGRGARWRINAAVLDEWLKDRVAA